MYFRNKDVVHGRGYALIYQPSQLQIKLGAFQYKWCNICGYVGHIMIIYHLQRHRARKEQQQLQNNKWCRYNGGAHLLGAWGGALGKAWHVPKCPPHLAVSGLTAGCNFW